MKCVRCGKVKDNGIVIKGRFYCLECMNNFIIPDGEDREIIL